MYRLVVLGILFAWFCGQIGAKSASHMYVFPSTNVTSFSEVLMNYPLLIIFISLFFSSHWMFYFFSYCNIFHVHAQSISS